MSSFPPPRADGPALTAREQRVLEAVIHEHLDRSEPVGSGALAQRLALSSASIRAVMGLLGERGLIDKPHASAGRVPTSLGLRFYVDSLLKLNAPPADLCREIAQRVQEAPTVDKAVEEAGRVLARLSQKACLVRAPRPEGVRLRHLELVRVRDDALLVILVTQDGSVQNRLVEMTERRLGGPERPLPDDGELLRMGRYLSGLVAGKSLAEVRSLLEREVRAAHAERVQLERDAIALGRAVLAHEDRAASEAVLVEGQRHLLADAAAKDVGRLQEVLALLEEREKLLALLDHADKAPGVRIFIGDENPLRELAELSVVTSSYGAGGEVFGALGVIGPVHMDYRRVVPLVEFTAQMISDVLR
ncbi:MAG: heat-inducible transcriptional repressor HrcA [Myxococcota bacterium]